MMTSSCLTVVYESVGGGSSFLSDGDVLWLLLNAFVGCFLGYSIIF